MQSDLRTTFFLIFVATIIVTRVLLYVRPIDSPTVWGFRVHHYMYGIIGLPVALLSNSLAMFAIALGLFVDELTWLALRGKNHADNYSTTSLLGTATLVVLIYFLANYLTQPFAT